jgi:Tfp pilus assembly protein FimT
LEALIVFAIMAIITAIAVLALGNTMQGLHANTGCQAALQVMRQARQQAIDQRTQINVIFNTPSTGLHTMTIQHIVPSAAPVVLATIPLPSDVQFFADTNIPGPPNTPDGIGNGKVAVDFEDGFSASGTTQVFFQPDGSVQNATGNTITGGVVYIERTGYWQGARAITLFGATGRLRTYQLTTVSGGGHAWQLSQ